MIMYNWWYMCWNCILFDVKIVVYLYVLDYDFWSVKGLRKIGIWVWFGWETAENAFCQWWRESPKWRSVRHRDEEDDESCLSWRVSAPCDRNYFLNDHQWRQISMPNEWQPSWLWRSNCHLCFNWFWCLVRFFIEVPIPQLISYC